MGSEGKDRVKLRFVWGWRPSESAYRVVAVVGLVLGLIGLVLGIVGVYLALHSN
jgi:hypothetical protein